MIFLLLFVILTCITIFVVLMRRLFYWRGLVAQGHAIVVSDEKMKKILRGPKSLPLIGGMHLLGGPGGPFECFTRIAKEYGDIYEIQLGVAKCVVVSNYDYIKEVLITKGNNFGGRPDFFRYHELFGGDRNNSLALCDWSDLQKKRRSLARHFCSPKGGSSELENLSRIATLETAELLSKLKESKSVEILDGKKSIKPLILASIGNMFTSYMCSTRFDYEDPEFQKIIRNFDEIFWDINQGYAVDFLPWLKPFYKKTMSRLRNWSVEIRIFILNRIIENHRLTLDRENKSVRDFTDALLHHLESPVSKESHLTWEHIMFELEDFLGGHSAVGNLVMLILAHIAVRQNVQEKIRSEAALIASEKGRKDGLVTMEDRADMPYTDAVIWETLRISSSPIVPHVATVDTEISGYPVSKDTVVFLNNFELNLGENYWGADSREFVPERFFKMENGKTRVVRPDYFIPFSTGKRTCVGQKLVQGFAFVVVTSLLSRYEIYPAGKDLEKEIRLGCVAVHPDPYHLELRPRNFECPK